MDAKVKIIKPKNGIVGKVSGRKKLMSVEIGSGATEIQGDSWEAHYEHHGFARKEEGGSSFEFFGEDF